MTFFHRQNEKYLRSEMYYSAVNAIHNYFFNKAGQVVCFVIFKPTITSN